MLLRTAATVVLLLWIFPPNGVWPLAFLALAPWCYGVCSTGRAWIIHWTSFLGGWAFYLVAARWLMPVTGLGYAALGMYLAIYWPMAAWAIRAGLRHGVSPVFTLPAAWVATEYLRGWVMSGFPWFFVGHALHEQSRFIQIADLAGAYGVSYLAIAFSGVIVEFFLQRNRRANQPARPRQLRFGGILAALLLGLSIAYGEYRVREFDAQMRAPDRPRGPVVSVVQEHYPLISTPPYSRATATKVFADYVKQAAEAARQKPDLIAFPETAWSGSQNREFIEKPLNAVDDVPAAMWHMGRFYDTVIRALCDADYSEINRRFSDLQKRMNESIREQAETLPVLSTEPADPVSVLVGTVAIETYSRETYPPTGKFNSAVVYDPGTGQRGARYDKVHLVPFGELVPFRKARFLGIDLHPLYRWLNRLSPFSFGGKVEYTLTAGDEFTIFDLPTDRGIFRFGVPICYEDVMPYVSRRFVWDGSTRRCDFLINISNDGWFRANELPQHLGICIFRAIENRTPIARAVNTGISAFVDSCGRVFASIEKNGEYWGVDVVGHLTREVPLDKRTTVYGQYGDWFAGLCLATAGALWLEAVVARWLFAIQHRLRRMRRLRRLRRRGAT